LNLLSGTLCGTFVVGFSAGFAGFSTGFEGFAELQEPESFIIILYSYYLLKKRI